MNKAIYTMMRRQRDLLSAKQNEVYRELKNLWRQSQRLAVVPTRTRFRLEELEEENEGLVNQIELINDKLLRFELFGQ